MTSQVNTPRLSVRFYLLWHGAALLLLPFGSSLIVFGELPWHTSHFPVLLGVAFAYLLGASVLLLLRADRRHPLLSITVTLVVLAGSYFVLLLFPEVPYSRRLLIIASSFAAILLPLPRLLSGKTKTAIRLRAARVLGSAVVITSFFTLLGLLGKEHKTSASRTEQGISSTGSTRVIETRFVGSHHHTLRATYYSGYFPPPRQPRILGGGLVAFDDGLLLLRGQGDLYQLRWMEPDSLHVRRLDPPVPINYRDFEADVPTQVSKRLFRVADLLIIQNADRRQILTTHHYWKRRDKCYVVRLSALTLSAEGVDASETGWRTLYDTKPCLPLKRTGHPFAGHQIGGRLAHYGSDHVLMTVGDHEFDGWNASRIVSQDPEVDYGKSLVVNTSTGTARLFTLGHRNPQGLFIDSRGRIWSTEHGPQGGDELNELVRNGNYGWPFQTLGTEYGSIRWPLNQPDPAAFEPPLYAWIPSIAISNLVRIERGEFPAWKNDLLVSSLSARTLFRVRLEQRRVLYVEPIAIDRSIRDLVEDSAGRIILWTDRQDLVRLERALSADDGAIVFLDKCKGCHEIGDGAQHRIGPDLAGVVERPIASVENFSYSEALRTLRGVWTADRLQGFLSDPDSFAPGTSMSVEGLADSTERVSLIEYLRAQE